MRTFNGLQIFTEQLTNSGQLDLRYVRITGNNQPANIYFGNLNQNYSFHQDQNFNITDSVNIFYSNSVNLDFTGFLPEVEDSKMITIKNLSNRPLYISGANISNIFDRSDEYLTLSAPHAITLLGVNNNTYTGWVNINSTQGIA